MNGRFYGEVPGYPKGSLFENRAALSAAKVHRPTQGGICGGADGAESIVVSGGYIDDVDNGTEIIYTGQGGNDQSTKRQTSDQTLTLGNAGLARSQIEGRPVRVIRGARHSSTHSPDRGYRYDGVYRVAEHWHEVGLDGFRIWRFRLLRIDDEDASRDSQVEDETPAGRTESTVQRIVRNTAIASELKRLHKHTCQVCGIRLVTPAGPYAEAAHIRGLGHPHNGTDVQSNLLCLCPNDHVLFDTGAIYIGTDWSVRRSATGERIAELKDHHLVDPRQITYHREHFAP